MPATAPCASMKRTIGANAFACASDHRPLSHAVMRPTGETPLASMITSPAPPTARLPRWTRCQSFAKPSTLEYWHIGETTMRLRRVRPRRGRGSKSTLPSSPTPLACGDMQGHRIAGGRAAPDLESRGRVQRSGELRDDLAGTHAEQRHEDAGDLDACSGQTDRQRTGRGGE